MFSSGSYGKGKRNKKELSIHSKHFPKLKHAISYEKKEIKGVF